MQNCQVGTSWSTGTSIHYCRDLDIVGHCASGIGKSGVTGTGYGLQVQQCTHSSIQRTSASDARYACQLEAGCTVTSGSTADLMKIGGLDSTVYASSTTFILGTTKKVAIAGSPAGTFYNMTNGGATDNTRDPNPSAPPPTRALVSGDVTCTWAAN